MIQSPDSVHFIPGDRQLWEEIQWRGRAFQSFKPKPVMWSQVAVDHFSLIMVVLIMSWLPKSNDSEMTFWKEVLVVAGEALQDCPGPRGLGKRGWNLPHLKPAVSNPFTEPSGDYLHIQPEPCYSESKSSPWMEPPVPTRPGPPAPRIRGLGPVPAAKKSTLGCILPEHSLAQLSLSSMSAFSPALF